MKTKLTTLLLSLLLLGNSLAAQEIFRNADLAISVLDKGVWVVETTDMTTMYIVEEDVMSSYWVNFAATGNPNGEGLPACPAFTNDAPAIIELGDEVRAAPLPFQKQVYFMNEINQ